MDGGLGVYNKEAATCWLSHSKKSDNNKSCISIHKTFNEAIKKEVLISYSPIFPVFLDQRLALTGSQLPASTISSALFLFPLSAHFLLGKLKSNPQIVDLTNVYISNGLASIIVLDFGLEGLEKLKYELREDITLFEYWALGSDGAIESSIVWENSIKNSQHIINDMDLFVGLPNELNGTTIDTYVEQINFSLKYLSSVYQKTNPLELNTLYKQAALISEMLKKLTELFVEVNAQDEVGEVEISKENLAKFFGLQNRINSYEAQLVEICASLSYAITQGASGISPILENPSPFPHQRLLGVGNSNKALIAFVRNIENAMNQSSVVDVIKDNYTNNNDTLISPKLLNYQSGEKYTKILDKNGTIQFFDQFKTAKNQTIPLITHFSLRHGFKESPVSVTAAAESLSHEMEPQWTLMTLSHEIMHSRVRAIVDAIMKIDADNTLVNHFQIFNTWIGNSNAPLINIKNVLRSTIYQFCRLYDSVESNSQNECKDFSRLPVILREQYVRHQMKVIELIVHFHDYFFIFQNDKDLYFKSIFVSWSKVSAPLLNHEYYLVRALATASIGSGLDYESAFEKSRLSVLEILIGLKESGWNCAFIGQCIKTLQDVDNIKLENDNVLYSKLLFDFKNSYFLIDQFSLYFSSVDLLKNLHYSEVAIANDENVHMIGSYGDGNFINPISYCLASLQKSLSKEHQVNDSRWLSAWNSIVISSYRMES